MSGTQGMTAHAHNLYTPSPSLGPLWLTCLLCHLLNTRLSELIYKMIITINNSVHVCVGVCMCGGQGQVSSSVTLFTTFPFLLFLFETGSLSEPVACWFSVTRWLANELQGSFCFCTPGPGLKPLRLALIGTSGINSSLCLHGRPFISRVISQAPDSVYLFSVL